MQQDNRAGRITYLDLLRGIAVFSMMMLHVCAARFDELSVDSFEWQVINVYDSLVRCCVPLFVMISGVFFLNPKKNYPLKKILSHNVLRIVTAFLFWSFCYAALMGIEEYRTINAEMIGSVVENTITGRYHLWFLNMIVGIYLVVPFLRKIAADKKLLEYYIILSFIVGNLWNLIEMIPVAGNLAGAVLDKSSLFMVMGYTGYFMAGYYFYTYEISKRMKNGIYFLGILSVLVTIIGTSMLSINAGMADRTLYNYLFPNTCMTTWAVFLFFKNCVSKVRFTERSKSMIGKISEVSLGMYLVHDFVNVALKMLHISAVSFTPVLAVPVLTAVVFGVSFLIAWVMSKIPIVRKYLM